MGDRGNIFFADGKQGESFIGMYMYAHWSGSSIWSIARDGLTRGRERWGDSQYLARIMFCELVRESVLDTTGFGLGTSIGDNEHAIVRVDDSAGTVSFHRQGTERSNHPGFASWSYADYIVAEPAELERAFLAPPEPEALPAAVVKRPSKPRAARAPAKRAKTAKPAAAKRKPAAAAKRKRARR